MLKRLVLKEKYLKDYLTRSDAYPMALLLLQRFLFQQRNHKLDYQQCHEYNVLPTPTKRYLLLQLNEFFHLVEC